MSIQKRVRWIERIDGVLYDEDVDIYTSAKAVLYEDGTNLEDNISNYVSSELVGNLEDLTTTDKSNLASAISEVKSVNDSHVESLESMSGGSKVFWLENDNTITYENVEVSTLPYVFYQGSAVVLDGEIHILGSGYSYVSGSYYVYPNAKYHYKFNGSTWESVSTLPYEFYVGCAVIYNNEIHILGSGYTNYDTNHYKFNGSNWESVSTLPYNFDIGSAIIYNNEIHILGGNSGTKSHYKWNGSSWESVSTLPYSMRNGSTTVLNEEIHILSSYDSSYIQYHYKYNGSAWESVSTLPYKLYGGRAIVLNGEIHIMGSNDSSYDNAHYKYNGSSWIKQSPYLPYNFIFGSTVLYQGAIHILGSNTDGGKQHYSISQF